jgi:hypothetical protein
VRGKSSFPSCAASTWSFPSASIPARVICQCGPHADAGVPQSAAMTKQMHRERFFMQVAARIIAFIADFAKIFFPNRLNYALYPTRMQREDNPSDLKNRLLYGAVIGSVLGMIIGTTPGTQPLVGVLSIVVSAAILSALAALSDSFWESLRAAWELVRIAFWRW